MSITVVDLSTCLDGAVLVTWLWMCKYSKPAAMPHYCMCACLLLSYSSTNYADRWHQVRRSLDRGDLFRRRLSSEQACNMSRKGSCQLSDANEQLSPTDLLLQIANQEHPGGSADASSGAWGSCNVEATHSEQQLTEVTSPRKAQQLLHGESAHAQLNSLLGWRQSSSQEACIPVQGACTAEPAMDLLPPDRQAMDRARSALADGAMPQGRGSEQAAMQQAVPVPVNFRTIAKQHAGPAEPGIGEQASWIGPRQDAEGLDDPRMRDAGGLRLTSGPQVRSESRVQAVLLPLCEYDPVGTRAAEQRPRLHNSAKLPRAGRGHGGQAMGRAWAAQPPEMHVGSDAAEQWTQRASEALVAEAERAVRSFTPWQQGMPAHGYLTDTRRPPVKQERPRSALAATEADLAATPHATPLPPPEQRLEPCSGLAPEIDERNSPAAPRPVHIAPTGHAGMPPFLIRPRSACSPIAAAMQSPADSTPPPAWGNTF